MTKDEAVTIASKVAIIERAVRQGRLEHALEQIRRLQNSIVCLFAQSTKESV